MRPYVRGGNMRAGAARTFFATCLVVLGLIHKELKAFTAPRAAAPPATKQQQHSLSRTAGKSLCGRNVRAAAQQMALPPRRIGACQPPGNRRRGLSPRRRMTNLRASFTSLVKDIATNPRVLLGEIAVVVILSGIFEKLEHRVRQHFARTGRETGAEIMNALFKEITTLGFVAFVIFLVTHTGMADIVAPYILRDGSIQVHGHNPLSATFETVHMMIFLLLVVLLMQASSMYIVSEQICDRWGGYERTVSYGNGKSTLESKFVEAGYLKRQSDPEEPRGVKLVPEKEFAYGDSWISRLMMRGRPLHKLLMWRAIRHEFLFPNEGEVLDGKKTVRVPDASLFSMEEYLRTRLGKVVLSLIHVDRITWVVTLAILAVPLYVCKLFPSIPNEAVHCFLAWSIAGIGLLMTVFLERDMFQLTPKIPKKVTDILKLFSGESFQTLRRSKLPGWRDRPLHYDEEATRQPLELPSAMSTQKKGFFSSKGYSLLFRMLSFFQAVSFTSLILSHLSSPFTSRAEWAWYLGALIEWPFFLFVVVPVIIRRLTVRNSIAYEKDDRLIRKVTTQTKESLLRDYARLVQIMGFERRASQTKAAWTSEDTWDSKQAIQTVLTGLRKFDDMPSTEKREIWAIFAAWDGENNGIAENREFLEAFSSMGGKRAQETTDNLVRMTDFDGAGNINWMKFKAIYGLATADESDELMREDFQESFEHLDANGNGELSIFELADGFKKMNIGIGLDDMANLLFLYFGMAKPTITIDEFVEWVVADRRSTLQMVQYRT
mmetsp:Transcript_47850/g.138369  ORF Transcript_47850/g.138369 Transcript_47850/m.138369 type:complete len:775 (-) Transcript_47850:73-2397(-)